jgi:hypothetical protein
MLSGHRDQFALNLTGALDQTVNVIEETHRNGN